MFLDGEYRICFEMSAAVNKKLRFMIKSNVGDDEFTDERKHVEKTLVGVLNEGVKKFIHHASQFRKIQKLNKEQDHLIFAVFFLIKISIYQIS